MRILSVAWKSLLEQVRDLRNLLLAVSLPAFFMVLFALPYAGGLPRYEILLVDEAPAGAPAPATAAVVKALEDARYSDGKPMLSVKRGTPGDAGEALRTQAVALQLVLPADFSNRVAARDPRVAEAVRLEGDPGSVNFNGARWVVDDVVESTLAVLQDRRPVARPEVRLLGALGRTEFDYVAPGVIIFAIMLLVAQTAMLVVAEVQTGTLQRFQLARAGTAALFGGISLSQMAIAAVQVPLMTGVALAMGFHASGSLLAAVAICMILSLSAVGLGLLVACLARTPAEASNLGAGVLLAVTFLSGAFFPVPELPFLHAFGRDLGPWHLFAAKHAFSALHQVLVYGTPASGVAFELIATGLLSLVYLAVGIAVFRRVRMRAATL